MTQTRRVRPARFEWKHRLHRAAQFKAVFTDKTYRPIRTAAFNVHRRDNNCRYPRLGIAVSRHAAGRAVDRNRIKRRIRETFRQQRHELPNRDFVVTCAARVNKAAGPAARGAVLGEWTAMLRQVWRDEAARQGAR